MSRCKCNVLRYKPKGKSRVGRCSRDADNDSEGGRYCWQHEQMRQRMVKRIRELWDAV